MKNSGTRPLVCILAYNNLCLFEFSIALEVFALPRPELEHWYDYQVIAATPDTLRGIGGVTVNAKYDLTALAKASLIVIPGWQGTPSAELIAALVTANRQGARIATICSGVFLPAACGLLNGKKATTHWQYADLLARQYSEIDVNPDVLYIDQGDVLTSAGSAAGLDLCLHIIRSDFGAKTANTVARRLVLPAHREGSQAQYIPRPTPKHVDLFSPLLDQIRSTLNEPWTTERMASSAAMSKRTLLRRFQESTGESPTTWLVMERLALTREMLETTDLNISQIAEATGFVTADILRHHFRRHFQLSPLRYRAQFYKQQTGAL
ncbi:transcriptional regulator FtrA [Saccharospirillum alexandrii]|uniref:transcriptional regulator FtrA n=1 Tax=Saccharospirillum alexandrii TaxID=2448477 RepID=UPI000FD7050F|nr:transcriptional regulator FtrA [Saccharospirillum alexandrii]